MTPTRSLLTGAALVLASASAPAALADTTQRTRASGSHNAVRCVAERYTGTVPRPDPGLDTTSLGSTAPASYEIGAPAGRVQRVMILIHGGGWEMVGQPVTATNARSHGHGRWLDGKR